MPSIHSKVLPAVLIGLAASAGSAHATYVGNLTITTAENTTQYLQNLDFATPGESSFVALGRASGTLSQAANLGCSAGDYSAISPGSIALIRRGGCTFGVKVQNAYTYGAVGVLIYNNVAGLVTPGIFDQTNVPMLLVTNSLGSTLISAMQSGPVTVDMGVAAAVPEPTSVALFIAGLACVGSTWRGKRASLRFPASASSQARTAV